MFIAENGKRDSERNHLDFQKKKHLNVPKTNISIRIERKRKKTQDKKMMRRIGGFKYCESGLRVGVEIRVQIEFED